MVKKILIPMFVAMFVFSGLFASFAPLVNPYYGGPGDGYAFSESPLAFSESPLGIYYGGSGDGYAFSESPLAFSEPPLEIYYGGLGDGYASLAISGDTPLPVELASFTVENTITAAIKLLWVTESEVENQGFIVERRVAGPQSTVSLWAEIAHYITHQELRGQGNATYRTEYRFTDKTVEPGKSYDYRLADVSYKGEKRYHTLMVYGIEVSALPAEFALMPAYPNPFNPVTTISFNIPPEQNTVALLIYDIKGQLLETLVSGELTPGFHTVVWNASMYSSGMYFVCLKHEQTSMIQKLMLLK